MTDKATGVEHAGMRRLAQDVIHFEDSTDEAIHWGFIELEAAALARMVLGLDPIPEGEDDHHEWEWVAQKIEEAENDA